MKNVLPVLCPSATSFSFLQIISNLKQLAIDSNSLSIAGALAAMLLKRVSACMFTSLLKV
jgi:hypothetical protein